MNDLDINGIDLSGFTTYSTSLTNHIAEYEKAQQERLEEIAENNAKKDAALFQVAEASKAQKELLEQQLAEVKEQNALLKENYRLLTELYESAKEKAKNSAKEARNSKIFGWVSFGVGTLIGVVGIIVAIIF